MTTSSAEQNLPTLKICFDQISHLFEEEKRNLNEKVSKLEEEKGVLYGLLQNRKDLEKENADLKSENKVLKEEISFLRLTSKESRAKLSELESKHEAFAKKQSEWARFAHTVRKKCTCKFNDRLKKSSDNLSSTPSFKIKNVSNVFFMSPVKSKSRDNATLAPMTEEYTVDGQHFKASTPVVVGESERSPCLYYEINSGDDDSDNERPCSPSLFSDPDSKIETPANRYKKEKFQKNFSINLCKPSSTNRLTLASPMDRLTLGDQKHERTETSAVLFSDDNGQKVTDISVESSDCNVDFHRSVTHLPKEEANSSRAVNKTGGGEKGDKKEGSRGTCFKEPLQPVLKKRKYASQEEDMDDEYQKMSNSRNINTNQTWARGNTVINPRNNTSKPMVIKNEVEIKAKKNISDAVDNPKNKENQKNKVTYKHSTVVRKKDERSKLSGFACEDCRRYYESDNLSKEQMQEVLKNCSRHKHVSAPPPSTPEQFWALEFPQTQDCIDKGYMLDENQTLPDHVKPKSKRGKKKKSVNFK